LAVAGGQGVLAGVHGSRTHPPPRWRRGNRFEDGEDHRAPSTPVDSDPSASRVGVRRLTATLTAKLSRRHSSRREDRIHSSSGVLLLESGIFSQVLDVDWRLRLVVELHRIRVRTTNLAEPSFVEERRPVKVIPSGAGTARSGSWLSQNGPKDGEP